MVKPVRLGNNDRMTFSKINEVIDMPNLIEIQKDSYKWFVEEGLKEVFRDMSDITDYSGNLRLSFVDYRLDDTPKYDVTECKARDTTYAAPLRVTAHLVNSETGEIKESDCGYNRHGNLIRLIPTQQHAESSIIRSRKNRLRYPQHCIIRPGILYDARYKVDARSHICGRNQKRKTYRKNSLFHKYTSLYFSINSKISFITSCLQISLCIS